MGVRGVLWVPSWLGVPWVSLRAHGFFRGPMGVPGVLWMPPHGWGSPGCPWGPMGALMVGGLMGVPEVPWVLQRSHGCPPMVGGPLGVPKGPRVSMGSYGCPPRLGVPWVSLWLEVPWVLQRSHGCPWGPMGAPYDWGSMGVHGVLWVPPHGWGSPGCPWGPMGVPKGPWVSVKSHGCPHGWGSPGCP